MLYCPITHHKKIKIGHDDVMRPIRISTPVNDINWSDILISLLHHFRAFRSIVRMYVEWEPSPPLLFVLFFQE